MAKKLAKKPAASVAKKKPAAKKKSATKPKPAAKKAKKTSPAPKPALSDEQIGYAAGAVWVALQESGPLTIAALKKAVGCPPDVTLMAIGWLARESKLHFDASSRSVRVSLRG